MQSQSTAMSADEIATWLIPLWLVVAIIVFPVWIVRGWWKDSRDRD